MLYIARALLLTRVDKFTLSEALEDDHLTDSRSIAFTMHILENLRCTHSIRQGRSEQWVGEITTPLGLLSVSKL